MKPCPLNQLRDTLKHLNESFGRLTGRKAWPAKGYLKTVEFKRRWNGEVHAHLHVLLLVPAGYMGRKYLSKVMWSKLWGESLRVDYDPIIYISQVKPYKHQQLLSLLIGIVRYQTKEADISEDRAWFAEMHKQVHCTNGISLGGVLKRYMREDDDPLTVDLQEFSQLKESDYFAAQMMELGRMPSRLKQGGAK